MSKIIGVDNCFGCPYGEPDGVHFSANFIKVDKLYCNKKREFVHYNIIPNAEPEPLKIMSPTDLEIPHWCPLEDKP